MSVRIVLDASALDRLIGDDRDLQLQLTQNAVDALAQSKLKPLLNDQRWEAMRQQIRRDLESFATRTLERMFREEADDVAGRIANPSVEVAWASRRGVAERLRDMVDAVIAERVQEWIAASADAIRKRVEEAIPREVERVVEQEIQARLNAARQARIGEARVSVRSLLLAEAARPGVPEIGRTGEAE